MNLTCKRLSGLGAIFLIITSLHAQYTEVMNKQGVTLNMKTDYSLVSDHAESNQSALIQKAVDDLYDKGGGCLIIPEGTYRFSGIWMKNNVHVLIESGTLIKAYWPEGEIVDVFKFDAEEDFKYVENISVRGLGGRYTIDYTEHGLVRGEGARFVNVGQVKNFLIADAVVLDNFTTYCAIAVGLSKIVDVDQEPRFRPTYGTVKNISIYNSGEGYGLTQLHRADHLYFENLYAKGGGITFRLETGGGGIHAGIYDIYAKNLICENGRQTVMMGPHTAQNGTVGIDGVTAIDCAWAVTVGGGFIDRKHEGVDEARLGRFADDSYVKNIRAVYGENAIVLTKRIDHYPAESVKKFKAPESPYMWSFRGPSLGGVDNNATSYKVSIENVIMEGFPEFSEAEMNANLGKKKDEILKDVPSWELVRELFKHKQNRSYVPDEEIMNKYFGCQARSADQKPNIIVILADDLSWSLPGFNGGTIVPSPNLDKLAKEGVMLTQFYAQSVCSPTRASFMTGRYPFRTGVEERPHSNDKAGMLSDERTLAEALSEAGYFTAITGKWHLGNWQKKHLPMQRGFQYQYGHYSALIDYYKHERENIPDWHRNEEPIEEEGYSTWLIADEVQSLLERQDKNKPFFYYVPFNAVHGPFQAPEEYVKKYENADSPVAPEQLAMFECLDIAIGKILNSVEENGFSENTLIVFFNDNGAGMRVGNYPYRLGKGKYYEGGLRVPCIFNWPGEINPGRKVDVPMHTVDLYPTLINIAGASLEQELPIDGLDAWLTITKGKALQRNEIVHCLKVTEDIGRPAPGSLRVGDFKLIGDELYNIAKDPYEKTDIAELYPEKVRQMKARLDELALERRQGEKHSPIPGYPPNVFGEEENKTYKK